MNFHVAKFYVCKFICISCLHYSYVYVLFGRG